MVVVIPTHSFPNNGDGKCRAFFTVSKRAGTPRRRSGRSPERETRACVMRAVMTCASTRHSMVSETVITWNHMLRTWRIDRVFGPRWVTLADRDGCVLEFPPDYNKPSKNHYICRTMFESLTADRWQVHFYQFWLYYYFALSTRKYIVYCRHESIPTFQTSNIAFGNSSLLQKGDMFIICPVFVVNHYFGVSYVLLFLTYLSTSVLLNKIPMNLV